MLRRSTIGSASHGTAGLQGGRVTSVNAFSNESTNFWLSQAVRGHVEADVVLTFCDAYEAPGADGDDCPAEKLSRRPGAADEGPMLRAGQA